MRSIERSGAGASPAAAAGPSPTRPPGTALAVVEQRAGDPQPASRTAASGSRLGVHATVTADRVPPSAAAPCTTTGIDPVDDATGGAAGVACVVATSGPSGTGAKRVGVGFTTRSGPTTDDGVRCTEAGSRRRPRRSRRRPRELGPGRRAVGGHDSGGGERGRWGRRHWRRSRELRPRRDGGRPRCLRRGCDRRGRRKADGRKARGGGANAAGACARPAAGPIGRAGRRRAVLRSRLRARTDRRAVA